MHNKKSVLSFILRLVLFIMLSVAIILPTYVIPKNRWDSASLLEKGTTGVRGTSMYPTIKDNDVVYINTETKCDRGEIVVFESESSLKYDSRSHPALMKRIVGLPGETVELTENGVKINGVLLSEPYSDNLDKTIVEGYEKEYVLSDNEYFLIGDNRDASFDSRHTGPVHKNKFMYSVTAEPNEHTKSIAKKNLITSIIILLVSILTPILLFFVLLYNKFPKTRNLRKCETVKN